MANSLVSLDEFTIQRKRLPKLDGAPVLLGAPDAEAGIKLDSHDTALPLSCRELDHARVAPSETCTACGA